MNTHLISAHAILARLARSFRPLCTGGVVAARPLPPRWWWFSRCENQRRVQRRNEVAGMNTMPAKLLGLFAALLGGVGVMNAAQVTLTIRESGRAQPLPARVHLQDSSRKPVKPPGSPAWHDHFVCAGSVEVALTSGQYGVEIEHGPEFSSVATNFTVGGSATNFSFTLSRIADLASEGWWSGETHVHRKPQEAELLMRAEDLHVAHFTTWWNKANPWMTEPLPQRLPVRFDGNRFYHPLGGEDERDGGALLYLDLTAPLDITGGTRHRPSSVAFAKQARERGAKWIDAEKPFWWDFPMWVAHGVVDTVGIAHNHMQRDGVLDNEAWGRARDRAIYAGPQGNGRYTQDIYYHLLNTGSRLPPSAGSASGVLPNPVGYNRAYAHVAGEFTYEKWRDGLKAGRSFVSNGPLLRARANGFLPGHVFRTNGSLQVLLEATLDSRDPVAAVELVRNGHIERVNLPSRITLQESGWFLLRTIADVTNTFRFAGTAPWYVEVDGKPMQPRRESAQFFVDWSRERMAKLDALTEITAAQKEELLQPWREAETFWQGKLTAARRTVTVTGQVMDAATRQPLESRLYLQKADGVWLFPASADPAGSAVRYEKQNWLNRQAIERHTTLSAHPWRAELEPGRYTVVVERGKEYRTLVREFTVGAEPVTLDLPLTRWVNMAARGWFSGDTHVHRTLSELRNVALAEDLNVTFPFTYWTTRAGEAPAHGDKTTAADAAAPAGLIRLDDTHVVWPRNTEWEISSVGGKPHMLGAVFALGHRTAFTNGAPPLTPIGDAVRRDGALFDMDKPDWPWALALVPLLNVDLYELANNHVWRTEFGFTNWSTPAPDYMGLPNGGRFGNERDWIEYTHRTYWTLLDCGFRLRPTAGTASGVHPVPLGFGRVYVHCPGGFSYDDWMKGLNEGRSFVTTGPMLLAEVTANQISGSVISQEPVKEIEVIINGDIRHRIALTSTTNANGAREARFHHAIQLEGASWVALRCWEPSGVDRERFAHTAPRWFDVPDQPLRPRQVEAEFLARRVREQIERSSGILPPEAIAEYRKALAIYESLAKSAR